MGLWWFVPAAWTHKNEAPVTCNTKEGTHTHVYIYAFNPIQAKPTDVTYLRRLVLELVVDPALEQLLVRHPDLHLWRLVGLEGVCWFVSDAHTRGGEDGKFYAAMCIK